MAAIFLTARRKKQWATPLERGYQSQQASAVQKAPFSAAGLLSLKRLACWLWSAH